MVVQIITAFPPVPQVQSAFCPGVTALHLLCWLPTLQHPFLNREANTAGVLITNADTVECVVNRTRCPPGFRS
jgi:hypothetical protein